MDSTQAAPYRQQLLAQQAALLAQLADQRGGTIGRAEAAADHFGQTEDPRAQIATERELAFALDERETAHLAAVEAALARMEAGTYGECTDCGTSITAARLHATPEAARCVHCQEKAEQHRRAA
ncbi:TraR/DksA family transcriptional regulator [Acidovorax sp. FJL06]|uniref:TraR/DksA family transcriptional regulator n=1 Tax=Acidovorax sp. FJL06 TaxID=2153365 RepID=UPI000F569B74|nr:TraR/DksA family transcriptional regulator [Acidovorax sp. FJL06]RQO81029.1 conjugal transfer protein TraR [Acidovorax sp. FJL06]